MTVKSLSLARIRIDGGTQSRACINLDTVAEYSDAISTGATMPPLDVFFDGAEYWLADGFHRWHAYATAEIGVAKCEVHKGTLRDAIWFSLSANAKNGIRRTNADKRKAVQIALNDGAWKEMNDDAIGEHIGVTSQFVNRVRNELETVSSSPPVKRTGKDGKKRPATYKKREKTEHVEVDEPEEIDEQDHQHGPSADTKDQARAALAELDACLQELGIDCDKEIAAIRIKLMNA